MSSGIALLFRGHAPNERGVASLQQFHATRVYITYFTLASVATTLRHAIDRLQRAARITFDLQPSADEDQTDLV